MYLVPCCCHYGGARVLKLYIASQSVMHLTVQYQPFLLDVTMIIETWLDESPLNDLK